MTTTLEQRPPAAADPVATLVGSLSRIQTAAADIIATVGRNEPIPTRAQLLLAGALDGALAAVDAYQSVAGHRPPVDMLDDPLAAYRLPSGAVAYETAYADEVTVGAWVQRCHGDPDWHHVTDVATYTVPSPSWFGQTAMWRITYDGTAHDWAGTDAIRIARPPADVVAGQERKAEASR